jgi:hypothetical protein
MRHREYIPPHYQSIRRLLNQLVSFAEAACDELGPESPLVAQYHDKRWVAQLQDVQRLLCERCGERFDSDVLGSEAYAVDAFQRACAACYAELGRSIGRPMQRLARLAAFAQEHPELMAGSIVQAQRRRQLADPELQHWLGIDATGVLRLALCPQPSVDNPESDIATIAACTGCTTATVRAILEESSTSRIATDTPEAATTDRPSQVHLNMSTDRVAWYHEVARTLVQRIAAEPGIDQDTDEQLYICDEARGHYIYMATGWHNHYRMYATLLHVRIKDGKIVIEQDGTDTFGDALRAAGVPQTDIIFGFLEPEAAILHG